MKDTVRTCQDEANVNMSAVTDEEKSVEKNSRGISRPKKKPKKKWQMKTGCTNCSQEEAAKQKDLKWKRIGNAKATIVELLKES
jgi:hypothetical protein